VRNIHLAVWGVGVAFGGMATQPGDVALVRANGFFGGYNSVVWTLVAVQVSICVDCCECWMFTVVREPSATILDQLSRGNFNTNEVLERKRDTMINRHEGWRTKNNKVECPFSYAMLCGVLFVYT